MADWNLYEKKFEIYGDSIRDRYINNIKDYLESDFENSPSCFNVTMNDSEDIIKVQIVEISDIPDDKKDYVKTIIMKPDDVIKRGDIIHWNDEIWLCTSMKIYGGIYHKGRIVQTNQILKFYQNKILRELPCFIASGSLNYLEIKDGRFLSVSDGRYSCITSDLGYINKDDLNLRFMIKESIYDVNGIDNITNNGLIMMELIDGKLSPNDNIELGIANYYGNIQEELEPKTESYVTLSPDVDTLILGKNVEFTGHYFENDIEDTNKFFKFTVINDDNADIKYTAYNTTLLMSAIKGAGKIINIRVELLGSPLIYADYKIKLIQF